MPITEESRPGAAPVMSTITTTIRRYDPDSGAPATFEDVTVAYEKDMRVLDVLNRAVEGCGISVAYRYFCGVKRCGLCAVTVNGRATLACWEKAEPGMVIEPLAKMRVLRDLVVDRAPIENRTVELDPRLHRDEPYGTFPEPLTHRDFGKAFPLMNCIECYVCTASCPAVPDEGPRPGNPHDFAGPGTLVQMAKAALHPKDGRARENLIEAANIDSCMSCGRCEEVCPNEIPIVSGAILPLKRIVATSSRGASSYPVRFARNVQRHGNVNSAMLFLEVKGVAGMLRALPTLLKMFLRGKTRVFGSASEAKAGISALFGHTRQAEDS